MMAKYILDVHIARKKWVDFTKAMSWVKFYFDYYDD